MVGLALGFGTAAALSTPGAVAAACAVPVLILFLLPVWSLPSVALVAFALLPVGYLSVVPRDLGRFLSPALVVMAIFLLRSAIAGGGFQTKMRWPALVLLLGLVALALIGINPPRSLLWVAIFAVGALIPTLTGNRTDQRMTEALTRTWLVTGGVLGAIAVLESLARFNPLSRFYYIDQHWSVYRVQTTLGHPLLNGTFFSLTSCFALMLALRHPLRRRSGLLIFAISGLAAVLSGSRSAAFALSIALGVGLVLSLFSRRISRSAKVAGTVLVALVVVVVPNSPIFVQRAGSSEGSASTTYRDAVVQLAFRLIEQRPLFGSGPGTSVQRAAEAGATLPLESAILGTVVSVGIVGAAGLALWLLWIVRQCLKHERPEVLTGLVAFLVTGSAFPLWESNPATWVLVGLLALLAAQTARRQPITEPRPSRRRSSQDRSSQPRSSQHKSSGRPLLAARGPR